MLNTVEAEAGTPNTKRAFSIPITAAASETKRMKGNRMRVSRTASSNLPGTAMEAEVGHLRPCSGAPMIATTHSRPMKTIMAVRIRLASSQAEAPRPPRPRRG